MWPLLPRPSGLGSPQRPRVRYLLCPHPPGRFLSARSPGTGARVPSSAPSSLSRAGGEPASFPTLLGPGSSPTQHVAEKAGCRRLVPWQMLTCRAAGCQQGGCPGSQKSGRREGGKNVLRKEASRALHEPLKAERGALAGGTGRIWAWARPGKASRGAGRRGGRQRMRLRPCPEWVSAPFGATRDPWCFRPTRVGLLGCVLMGWVLGAALPPSWASVWTLWGMHWGFWEVGGLRWVQRSLSCPLSSLGALLLPPGGHPSQGVRVVGPAPRCPWASSGGSSRELPASPAFHLPCPHPPYPQILGLETPGSPLAGQLPRQWAQDRAPPLRQVKRQALSSSAAAPPRCPRALAFLAFGFYF